MEIRKGMTMEEVEEMVADMDWEIFDEQEEDGCYSCTVWQGDHAVGVGYDVHDVVVDLCYVPLWAIC